MTSLQRRNVNRLYTYFPQARAGRIVGQANKITASQEHARVCVRAARPAGWRGSFRDGPRNCPPDVSEFGERERSTVLYRRKFPARGSILFFFFSIRRCGFRNEKSMSDTDILVDKEGIYRYGENSVCKLYFFKKKIYFYSSAAGWLLLFK